MEQLLFKATKIYNALIVSKHHTPKTADYCSDLKHKPDRCKMFKYKCRYIADHNVYKAQVTLFRHFIPNRSYPFTCQWDIYFSTDMISVVEHPISKEYNIRNDYRNPRSEQYHI